MFYLPDIGILHVSCAPYFLYILTYIVCLFSLFYYMLIIFCLYASWSCFCFLFYCYKQMTAGSVMLTDSVYWFVIFPFLTIKEYNMNFVSTPFLFISMNLFSPCLRFFLHPF